MPYLNEHAARLRDPADFVAGKFRRENNKLGDGVHVIFGELTATGKMEMQAIRFSAEKFSAAQALSWLRDHDIEPILFEPARGKEKMSVDNVPLSAMCFSAGVPTISEKNGEAAKSQPIEILLRTGQPIDHWYWGRVIHDADGMRLHKQRLSIDYNHDPGEIVGYLNRFSRDEAGNMRASGALCPFRENDRATEIIYKMREGVPYEASIFFTNPICEELGVGETAEVNGYMIDGPAMIIRDWTLRGVAICPYGADQNTETVLSGDSNKNMRVEIWREKMKENETAEPQPVEAEKKAEGEGVDGGLAALESAQPNEPEESEGDGRMFMRLFGRERGAVWYAEGLSIEQARERCLEELRKENEELRAQVSALSATGEKPLSPAPVSEEEEDFLKAAHKLAICHDLSLREAMRRVARERPELVEKTRRKANG